MSETLLPCPRCGGEMSVFRADGYTWDVMCSGPDCIDEKVFTSREDAIGAANRRTPGPHTAKLLEYANGLLGYLAVHGMKTYCDALAAFIAEHEPVKPAQE